jgi:hypothetical protein
MRGIQPRPVIDVHVHPIIAHLAGTIDASNHIAVLRELWCGRTPVGGVPVDTTLVDGAGFVASAINVFCVCGPTTPSGVNPCCRWKCLMAAFVAASMWPVVGTLDSPAIRSCA